MEKRPYGWLILLAVLIVAGTGAAAFYVGYRIGVDRAFYRDTRLAESPEPTSSVPAVWKDPPTTEPAGPPPAIKTAPFRSPSTSPSRYESVGRWTSGRTSAWTRRTRACASAPAKG